jgi:Calcium binding
MEERGKRKMPKLDLTREHRIVYEIVVDCYDEFEVASAWYAYMQDKLEFPFQAKCVVRNGSGALDFGEEITVIGLLDQEECEDGLNVLIEYLEDEIDVPLEELECITGSDETKMAVDDWRYGVAHGYSYDISSEDEDDDDDDDDDE